MPDRRVVVVEDEPLIRLDLVEMLREAGYQVVGEAGNGEAAIRMVRELLPDIVLMDVKMPVLDGVSAAEVLAAESIAPIVMLTAFSQSELVERALAAGVQGYVVKPFTMTDLRTRLMANLERARDRTRETAWRRAAMTTSSSSVGGIGVLLGRCGGRSTLATACGTMVPAG